MAIVERKECSICKKVKPITMFFSDGRYSSGQKRYRPECKVCYTAKRKKNEEAKLLKEVKE